MFGEPGIGICLGDDSKHLDVRPGHVVENTSFTNAKAILGLTKAPQSLDSTLTDSLRFMAQMLLHRLLNRTAVNGPKRSQVVRDFRGQYDFIGHAEANSNELNRGDNPIAAGKVREPQILCAANNFTAVDRKTRAVKEWRRPGTSSR